MIKALWRFLFKRPDVHFGEVSFLRTTREKTRIISGVQFSWERAQWQIRVSDVWYPADNELAARNELDVEPGTPPIGDEIPVTYADAIRDLNYRSETDEPWTFHNPLKVTDFENAECLDGLTWFQHAIDTQPQGPRYRELLAVVRNEYQGEWWVVRIGREPRHAIVITGYGDVPGSAPYGIRTYAVET